MAEAKLHRVSTSLQAGVRTHRQVLLQVKPGSRQRYNKGPCTCSILDVHQLLRSQAGTGVRCWILKIPYIPQCRVVFLQKLGPACLSWCQRSRTCLKMTKTFLVRVHLYLLWSSN